MILKREMERFGQDLRKALNPKPLHPKPLLAIFRTTVGRLLDSALIQVGPRFDATVASLTS